MAKTKLQPEAEVQDDEPSDAHVDPRESLIQRLDGENHPIICTHFVRDDGNVTGGAAHGEGFRINWQDGPIVHSQQNGALAEDVIMAVINRLEAYQQAPLKNEFTNAAVFHLRESLRRLDDRTADRRLRKVEASYTA